MQKLGISRPAHAGRSRHTSGIHGRLNVTVINWHLDPNSALWRSGAYRCGGTIFIELSGISHERKWGVDLLILLIVTVVVMVIS